MFTLLLAAKAMKDLWCSSTAQLLSTQTLVNVLRSILGYSLNYHAKFIYVSPFHTTYDTISATFAHKVV